MKKLLLLFFMLNVAFGYSQQVILLVTDTISAQDNAFDFTTGGVGSMTGNNKWVINNNYTGGGIYPPTTRQDSVVPGFGTIDHAPYSYYLHIYDSVGAISTGVSGCDWNPANASDRFVFFNNGFCSLGLTNVTFTFFWIAGGDSFSYGELYYRSNGGTWKKTGRNKYNAQTDWLYETVTDTGFNNKQNLQFGFRWVNAAGTTSPDMSFGVDDIIAVGTYNDAVTNPVKISVTSFLPDTVCENQYLFFTYKLSAPLCDGQYEVGILNSAYQNVTGNSITNFTVFAPDTTGSVFMQLPTGLVGPCFHIVLTRASPPPYFVSDTSICFTIIRCPTTIFTQSVPVTTDADTACVLSEVDVYFTSDGTFNANNIYTAQISDSTGSFAHPITIGTLPSSLDYGFPPGDVSGLIPASVPPGCGYYIRVISSSPSTIGTTYGPFCVKHCDEETNNITDLKYCIGFPHPTDTQTFVIKTHEWNNQAIYDTCNNFTVQLLDMMTFGIVNTGGIGIFHVNRSDTFQLVVGPPAALAAAGIAPGAYYLRVLSSCSHSPSDTQGTVIRITIGEPNPAAEILTAMPDTVCLNVASYISFNPYNFQSSYIWISPAFNNGLPSAIPQYYNEFGVIFNTGAASGFYTFQVQETNFGCPGPFSPLDSVLVINTPKAQISGPALTCLGDTATFYATFTEATHWDWSTVPGSRIVALGNNERVLVFDSAGTYTISDQAENPCGFDVDTFKFTVASLLNVQIMPPGQSICQGDSLKLTASTIGAPHALLTIDSGTIGYPGAMFNLIAHDNLIIDSFACKVLTRAHAQVNLSLYQRLGQYQGYEQNSSAWNFILSSTPTLATTNAMTAMDYAGLTMNAGDTFGIYITDQDQPVVNIAYSPPAAPPVAGTVYKSDGVIDFVQGSINALSGGSPFGASLSPKVWNGVVYYHTLAGVHFAWNTGDTTVAVSASPPSDSNYSVRVFDNTGCHATDTVLIRVNPKPTLSVGPDTAICDGLSYLIPGIASTPNVVWSPSTGLDNPNIVAPTFHYSDSVSYVVVATIDSSKCADTVNLKIAALNCASYIDAPQAFSPNGNGTNDHFTIFANKIASYDLRIYNRWGQLVYQTSDLLELNDMTKGWDGTYEGKPQNVGTFVYYLSATDEYHKQITKKGNITLLR